MRGEAPVQSNSKLEAISPLIVDPLNHDRLDIEHDPLGNPVEFVSPGARASYPIRNGIPDLVPNSDALEAYFGSDIYRKWRALQDDAEESYAMRTEGHFSTQNYQPAIDYAKIVAGTPVGRFLDVGCGKLARPAYMGLSSHQFVGIDPIEALTERDFPFARALGDLLPFADRSFDGVMFSSSLDHCVSPITALREAWRVTRPGGHLLVLESVRKDDDRYRSWLTAAQQQMTQFNKHHFWAFTLESLPITVQSVGFDVVSTDATSSPDEAVLVARRPRLRKRNRTSTYESSWTYCGPVDSGS